VRGEERVTVRYRCADAIANTYDRDYACITIFIFVECDVCVHEYMWVGVHVRVLVFLIDLVASQREERAKRIAEQ
jgi:hypothetical protein